jgi:hypothetical protein
MLGSEKRKSNREARTAADAAAVPRIAELRNPRDCVARSERALLQGHSNWRYNRSLVIHRRRAQTYRRARKGRLHVENVYRHSFYIFGFCGL